MSWRTPPLSLTYTDVPNGYVLNRIVMFGGSAAIRIDWGDGTFTNTTVSTSPVTHTYTNSGVATYTVLIYVATGGSIPQLGTTNNESPIAPYLTSINSWGNIGVTTLGQFAGSASLVTVPNYIPSAVTNIPILFNKCSGLAYDALTDWNYGGGGMYLTFGKMGNWDGDLSRFNVSNVTSMPYLFFATNFDSDISQWNVNLVSNAVGMWHSNSRFNQNLGKWKATFPNMPLTLDTLNTTMTLIGWAAQTGLPTGFSSSLYGSFYASGQTAYNYLKNTLGWTFPVLTATPIATPDLIVRYNLPRTRIFKRGLLNVPYIPSFTGTYSYVVFSSTPSLSTIGLSLDASGVISGIPTVVSSPTVYTVTCSAYNSSNVFLRDASFNLTFSVISQNIYYSPSSYSFFRNTIVSPSLTPVVDSLITIISYTIDPALPAGLVIDGSFGVISGTPTALSDRTTYTITANDSTKSYGTTISLAVADISYAPVSTYAYLSDVSINNINPTVFSFLYDASYNFTPPLPSGLSLNTTTGRISGTPTKDLSLNTYNLNVATISNHSKSFAFPMKVADISYTNLEYNFIVNTAVTPIQPKNYTSLQDASLNFAGGLLSGLAMDASGTITGTPTAVTAATNYPLTIRTTNQTTPVYSKTVRFTLGAILPMELLRTPPMSLTLTGVPSNYSTGFSLSGITGTYQIDWGDGITNANTATHTYVTGGTYTILLYVALTGRILTYNGMTNKTYLTSINNWGDLSGVTSLSNVGGPVFVSVPNNLPSTVTSIQSIFEGCSIFNGNVSQWNVSNVTNTSRAFYGCDAFNGDITQWNMSNVTNISNMFFGTYAFNQDITNWNISKVTTMSSIFYYATAINQNLGLWRIPVGTNLSGWMYGNRFDLLNVSTAVIKWAALIPNIASGVNLNNMIGTTTAYNNPNQYYNSALYAASTAAVNALKAAPYSWSINVTNYVATPVLAFQYNQSRTRIYTLGRTILPYTPSVIGTYSYVVFSSVPPLSTIGLTLNTSTGVISGTPTVVNSPTVYNLKCSAYNSGNTLLTDASLNLTFSVISQTFYYAPSNYSFLRNAVVSPTLTPTVYEPVTIVSYSLSPALPTGLAIDASYGVISGTPTVASNTATYTITAIGSTSAQYTSTVNLTVADISYAPVSTYAYLSDVSINNINPTVFSNLYDGSYNFSPALPTGLAINSLTGRISGTPVNDSSLNTYNLNVTTSSNYSKSFAFPIKVADISYTTLSYGFVKSTAITPVQPKNFTSLQDASLNFAAGLAGGLVMDASGSITGTPTTVAAPTSYPLTIRTSNQYTPVYNKIVRFTMGVILPMESLRTPPMSLTITSVPANYTTGFTLSDISGSYQIDWGDGTTDANTSTHTYVTGGTYTILIYVSLTGRILTYGGMTNNTYLTSINAWGDLGGVTEVSNVGGPVLVAVPNNLPSTVTKLYYTFLNCPVFNGDISEWNVSNVTNMIATFINCTAFNSDISRWNVKNVTDMHRMFNGSVFNQDIGQWNVSNVRDMTYMFENAAFNQYIGKWNVSKVTNMFRMFSGTSAFNQDISKWNVINCGSINQMFYNATAFDQNIGSWDISNALVQQPFFGNNSFTTVNKSVMVIQWAALPYVKRNGDISYLGGQFYTAAQAAATLLETNYGWNVGACNIPTPVLDVKYNQPRTRIYTLGSSILSYNPSLIGTYDHVVFSSTPALSTIGLTLDASGVISGTPTAVSNPTVYTVTCSAYNSGNTLLKDASFNLTFSVIPANVSYSPSSYSFFKNTVVSPTITPTVTGGMIIESYSVSPALPSGLVIDGSNGIISGTPTDVSNTAVYTVTATDDTSAVYTTSLSLTVADISYAPVSTYAYLSDVSINVIQPTVFSYLYDASFNFSPALPTGLAINSVTGDISGTPLNDVSLNTYNLTVRTISNYSKSFAFPIKVVDISYTTVSYSFLNNTTLNAIQPKNFTSLQDASLNFAGGLPSGVVMDASGSITGTPSAGSYRTTYPLTIRTSNNFTPVYSKDIPFTITVSDISYAKVAYQFLSDVSINTITPTSNYDASVNFTTPLPSGLTLDASGNIRGTPMGDSAKGTYNLNISTTSNYSKSIPFTIDVVDISYSQTTYGFVGTVAITPIQPKNFTSLHDASLNFAGGLPIGLAMDASGTISGTPTTATAPTSYPLTIRTTNQYTPVYSKTVPFTMGVILPLESLRTPPMSITLTSVPNNYSTGLNISDISGSYQIDWGDGITIANTSTHTYTSAGTYTILLYVEKNSRIRTYGGMTNSSRLTSINDWGDLGGVTTLTTVGGTALVAVPNNLPRTAINLDYMFTGCSAFNGDISRWNTSNVTGMYYMFNGCSAFNGDITRWNTGKVTNMYLMFEGCPFNQDISHWNTGENTDFNFFLQTTGNFNQNLGSWDIRKYTVSSRNFWQKIQSMSTLNWSLTIMGWASQTPLYAINQTTSNLYFSIYDVAQSAYNTLVAAGWGFYPAPTIIATPVLAVSYNESRTRVYTLGSPILSYIPSLLGTYNYVVFTSTPALSTIGLTLDASGVISGAPTVLSSPTVYNVKCSAYNAGNTLLADASFNLTFSVIPSNVYYSPSSYSFFSNMALSPTITPTITGGVTIVSYTVNPALPAGLAIDPSYGIISGTPTDVSNTRVFTVTATDTNDEVYTTSLSLTVADISYAPALTYSYLVDVSINVISPSVFSYLYDASFNFSPDLPTGLAINSVTGDISGTPLKDASLNTYNLTVRTFSNYSKTFAFPINVVDISYTTLGYEFVSNVPLNAIQPKNFTSLQDASLNFADGLPAGLAIDASGSISGTPNVGSYPQTYPLTIRTSSNYTPVYSKVVPFTFGVADISYASVVYDFLADVSINPIQPFLNIDASLNFTTALPAGLTMDASGNINGTPSISVPRTNYNLLISTYSNYSKSIPFTLSVSDVSYSNLNYEFLVDVSVNITTQATNYDASLNFSPPLPAGLQIDASGNIVGTPLIDVSFNTYNLIVSTPSNYSKTIPFNIGVIDISYAETSYEFVANVSLNPILPLNYTSLLDGSLNFFNGLPPGLVIDQSGNISGTPLTGSHPLVYPLTISTSSNYTPTYNKTIPFTLGVADISYSQINYEFLVDVSINTISPSLNYDVSLNFSPPLPTGLAMDASGTITGIPTNYAVFNNYNLSISTASNYSKIIPFLIGVVDISYTETSYKFISNVNLNPIFPNDQGIPVQDASVNFYGGLPDGITVSSNGTISGKPNVGSLPQTYPLTISTSSNFTPTYSKTFPLTFSVADISYTQLDYEFLSDVSINTIAPTLNYDASLNFSPPLPDGLTMDASGVITGTVTTDVPRNIYNLTIVASNYSKILQFNIGVVDISYTETIYEFVSDVLLYPIIPINSFSVQDASLNFYGGLPSGLALDTSGNINGTPITASNPQTYPLTISTSANYPPTYNKTIPFTLSVADISYAQLAYEFLADVSINIISPTLNYDASLNFLQPLPDGLTMDASGTITGTVTTDVPRNIYNLIITTASNYSKTLSFDIGVVDISYAQTIYEFLADASLNPILPLTYTSLQDASLNFYGGLPSGLALDSSGNITGKPVTGSHPQTYPLTISTSANYPPTYNKTMPFTLSVADISYTQLAYEFLSDVSINTISPSLNYNASFEIQPPLPAGLAIDASGTINGTVFTDVSRNSYNLTITTTSNYSKTLSFDIGVVDISYAQLGYEFLADVSFNPILPKNYTSLKDASLNFLNGLPAGLTLDEAGNINGTPISAFARSIYPLTISTSVNYPPTYSKQVPFSFGAVDISYTNIVYTFLADISINAIVPRSYTDLYDASINFYGGLPTGLAIDTSGNINGTPENILQTTIFPLTISTSGNYSPMYNKTVPFTITVDDISYTNLNYGFLNDVSVNIQPLHLLTNLYDASLNFSYALPSGLSIDTSGNITGTPNQPTAPTNNNLTLSVPGYSKTIPFNFRVSDISYVNVIYDFFSGVPIRDISAINPNDIYGATLNFPALPGIIVDASGTISGTPTYSSNQQEFDLIITTFSNYQKTIPFFITVANIYYSNIFYNFLSDVQINTIIPNTSNLNNATFSFDPALPNGLAIDSDGIISGKPVNAAAAALYTLAVTTTSDYTKQMPFQFTIADISYSTLTYGFLVNEFIQEIHPDPLNTLYGATIEFDALPAGLTYDAIGNITGNPLYEAAPTPYILTITTSQFYEDIYSKSLIFTITVSDISYTTLNYGFLSNITINDISSNSSASLYDVSLNFTPPLPAGLIIDGSGNISGTPTNAVAPAIYDLTITSASNSVKTIPFKITVSDVSYVILDFGLIANIALNDISANVPNTLYDASLNFSPALPAGLRMDGSGNIVGTPQNPIALSEYNLTLTSLSNYTKVLPFHFTVSDISYATLDYGFLLDVVLRDISANAPSTLYDASINFTQPLPLGLSFDGSGTIIGTPLETVAPSQYDLTLTSFSNYTKVLPFQLTVSDISYANLTYEFLSDVAIKDISVNEPNTVYNASLNFNPPLPTGLIVDGSGTILGTPRGAAAPAEYDLTMTTLSNYTKVIPFQLTVSDLSYTTLTYGFLANQIIRDISAVDAAALYGATFNFTPELPPGLTIDSSGTITGTPIVTAAPAEYDLNITISDYHKILPFNLRVSDLSYADLTYAFLADVVINTIQPTVYNVLYDASVNVQPPLPLGLTIDASGNILGTPFVAAAPTTYTLTVTTLSNYTRDLPLNFTVSDLSYVDLSYNFLANVPIIEIQPTDQNSVYGATINFTQPLPLGLALDFSGNISGSPNNASDPAIYPLTISVPGYSKAINFAISVSDLSYSELDYIFLAETPIFPLTPSIFSNLQTYTLTLDIALQNGLTFNPVTGIFTGTPLVLADEVDYQLTVSSNVYQKTMTFAFTVTDIIYSDLSYNYLENKEFLYTPIELRGFNLAPDVFPPNTFDSLIFIPALPTNLVIDLTYGVITGIPNIAAEANNYILNATTKSGYTKQIKLNIQIEGFAYIINVPRPEYSFYLYDTVKLPLVLNVGDYSNFIISPQLPGGLSLDPITGTIFGEIKLFQANEIYLFFITGFNDASITIPIIINIINPYATPCEYRCLPAISIRRQIDNMNTRAMRFSSIVRNGLGQTRFISNFGTNINRTYSEPPRNKF